MASPSMILSLLGTLDDHADSAHLEKLYSGVAAAAYTGSYYSDRRKEKDQLTFIRRLRYG